jgi:Family of unknown function (DUF6065)
MNENVNVDTAKMGTDCPESLKYAACDCERSADRVASLGQPEAQDPDAVGRNGPELIAYRTHPGCDMKVVPAAASREWMTATRGFAQRCLPLLMANQAGWFILNSHTVRITWNGLEDRSGIKVEHLSGVCPYPVSSHFGFGIATWVVPYLFRTSPGFNILARGPANWPKDGIYPLEGIVETDWSVATFTMNWRMSRQDCPITFEAGEPICMLVPQRRSDLETFRPSLRELVEDPALARSHRLWAEDRRRFLSDLAKPGSEAAQEGWQKLYFRGETTEGARSPEHQTKLHLQEFLAGGKETGRC